MVSKSTQPQRNCSTPNIGGAQFQSKSTSSSISILNFKKSLDWMKQSLLLVLLLFVSLMFANKANAQCTTPTIQCKPAALIPAIELDINGEKALTPIIQDFILASNPGDCGTTTTLDIVPAMVNCTDIGGPLTITLTISDDVGNSATCTTEITVVDARPPDFTFCPSDMTLSCGASTSPSATGTATATDNCAATPTVSYVDVVTGVPGDCETIQRTWSAVDAYMNVRTCVQTITVEDNNDPVLDFDNTTTVNSNPPAATTIECDAVPLASPYVVARDACMSVDPSVLETDVELNRSADPSVCGFYNYDIQRTWSASDNCGHTSSASQLITVEDTSAPEFTVAPADTGRLQLPATLGCAANVNIDLTGLNSDNCAGNAYLIDSFKVVERGNGLVHLAAAGLNTAVGNPYYAGDYNFVFYSTDPCGNTGSFSRRVTIVDNIAPSVACIINKTLTVPASGSVTITPAMIDNGSSDACSPITLSVNPNVADCSDLANGFIRVWLKATDASGNSDSCRTRIQLRDAPPAALCDPITVYLDAMGNYTLSNADLMTMGAQSYDACNGPLSFSASPSYFDCSDLGANNVTLTVTNSALPINKSSTCTSVVTVLDTIDPVASCQSISVLLDQNGSADVEGGWLMSGDYEIFMSSGENGSGLVGTTMYALTAAADGNFNFDYDYEGLETIDFDSLGYQIDGGAVTWLAAANGAVSGSVSLPVLAGETLTLLMRTVDNTGAGARARLYNIATGAMPAAGLNGDFQPGFWLRSYDNANGVAFIAGNDIWTSDNCTLPWDLELKTSPLSLDCEDMAGADVDLIVIDASGNSDTCTATVSTIDNLPPTYVCQDFMAQLRGDSVLVEAGWLVAGDRKIFMTNRNSNASNTDYTVRVKTPTSISFDWDFNSEDASNEDQFGYLLNGTFNRLDNQTGPVSISLSPNDIFGFRMTSDGDNNLTNVKIDGFGANFTGDFDPVRWNRTPNVPGDRGRVFIYGDILDNCSDLSELRVQLWSNGNWRGLWRRIERFECGDVGSHTNNLDIRDAEGNLASCSVTVDVIDVEAPVPACPPSLASTLNQDGYYFPQTGFVTNWSTDNCGILSVTVDPDTLDCTNVGSNMVTYTVEDINGNTATCISEIIIQELTPPSIVCPFDITIDCAEDTTTVVTGVATATDNCSSVSIHYVDAPISPCVMDIMTLSRTWYATDLAGNVSSCIQTISIEDSNAPVLGVIMDPMDPGNHNDFTMEACDPIPAAPAMTFTDMGCMAALTYDSIRRNYSSNTGNIGHYVYDIERTWTVTDLCGRSDSYTQTVEIRDTEQPVFDYTNDTIVATAVNSCGIYLNIDLSPYVSDCLPLSMLDLSHDGPHGDQNTLDASGYYSAGTYSITFQAKDRTNMLPGTHTLNLTVQDYTAPTAVCRDSHYLRVNHTIYLAPPTNIGTIAVADVDNGSFDNCGIASMTLEPNIFDCSDLGWNPVMLIVRDVAGNSDTCFTHVYVESLSNLITCPTDLTIDCSEDIHDLANVTGEPVLTGACVGATVPYTYTDVNLSGTSNHCRTVERTFVSGSATCTQIIMVEDNVAPVFSVMVDARDTFQCVISPASANAITATDNCNPPVSIVPVDVEIGRSANPLDCAYYTYGVNRSWQVTDSCGNSAYMSQYITVEDTLAPYFTLSDTIVYPTELNVCEATFNINLADSTFDACAATNHLTLSVLSGTLSGTFGPGFYPVEVSAADPCGNTATKTVVIEVRDMQSPDAICLQNFSIILDNNGQATLIPADVDNGSTDNCTPQANLGLTIVPSSFTTADIGPVQITLTVTDDAGNSRFCIADATVIGGLVFSSGNAVTPDNVSTDSVAIMANNFDNVTSFDLDVNIVDAAVAARDAVVSVNTDIDEGIYSITPNGSNGYSITWAYNPAVSGGTSLTLADGTPLFYVKYTRTGAAGTMTDVVLSMSAASNSGGPVPTGTVNGTIQVIQGVSLFQASGALITEARTGHPAVPIENATVNLAYSGSTAQTATTGPTGPNGAGTYSFGNIPNGTDATFTASKSIDWWEGITMTDAMLAQQAVFPNGPLTPYQQLAADVSPLTTGVTGYDVNRIMFLALHLIPNVPGYTSWRFIPTVPGLPANPFTTPFDEFYNVNPVSGDLTNLDFVGIKPGDVNGSANPTLRPADATSFAPGLEFYLDDATAHAGTIVAVPFKARDFEDVNVFQFTLGFDAALMELVDIVPGALPNLTTINFNRTLTEEGKLAIGWFNTDAISMDNDETLFTLYFNIQKGSFKLSEVLNTNESYIPMEVVIENEAPSNQVDLVFGLTSNIDNISKLNFQVYQNVPNPFSEETVIGFSLPEASAARIMIYNAAGRQVKEITGDFTLGYNEVKVSKADLQANGVFLYRIDTAFGSAVRKMILFKK